MNANAIAMSYNSLTPEERFRLVVAAGARGDDTERDRLVSAGGRITLSMPDHCPYAHAFDELAVRFYIELLEEAARYLEALDRADDDRDRCGDDGEGEEGEEAGEAEERESVEGGEPGPESRTGRRAMSLGERYLNLALAAGFMLRTKAEGWKLFCERLSLPPLLLWEGYPGFDRLRRALALAEKAAFVPEGFLRWMNDVRPAGEPELTAVPLTAEGLADATAKAYREWTAWWGGG
jgi:hypothetical protein